MSVDYVKANENIVEDSKDLVLTQFAEAENIQKFVEIIAEEAKSYEEVAEKIFTSFLLVNATGFTLDSIGEFLNFPRDGRDDDEYRTVLIISAIGANSKITRDSIYSLVEIVTGGLGGKFYNGRYHDLYIYLQDACVERAIAAEFLDKYLPANTQASVLFESGDSFGFDGNDDALGFSRVYQTNGEGDAYLRLSYSTITSAISPVLPRAFEFLGTNDYTYRTEFDADMSERVRAIYWDIPGDYVSGDVVSVVARNNITRELVEDSLTIANTGTSQQEIATFLSDFFVNNGIIVIENVVEDTTDGHKIYIGVEAGLSAPVADPKIDGFSDDYTIIFDVKNESGIEFYCRSGLINKTKGSITTSWGTDFSEVVEAPFDIISTQAGSDFSDGFGEVGAVIPDVPFSEAGGFCTRASLTSRDILGYGTLASPEEFEYDLDSKLSDVVGLSRYEGFANFRTPVLLGDYNLFRPHDWDVTLSTASPSTSQSAVLRSPEGAEALGKIAEVSVAASDIDTKPEEYGDSDINAADITFPSKPYYYEVDLEKLINSTAVIGSAVRMDANSFKSTTATVGGETVISVNRSNHYLTVQNEYTGTASDYIVRVIAFNNSTAYDYNVDTDTYSNQTFASGYADEFVLEYTDATAEGSKNIGVYYDPINRTYRVYINGVPYNGTDGFLRYEILTGADTTGASAGDIYEAPIQYNNSGVFQTFFEIENANPEPSTIDDYGTIEFIYDRNELKYTSQLPANTVDIFGRRITQES